MSDVDMSALPGVRRIITGHNDAGIAVVRSEDVVAPEVRRSCCPSSYPTHCWLHRRAAFPALAATSSGSRPKHPLMTTTTSAYIIIIIGRTSYEVHMAFQGRRDDENSRRRVRPGRPQWD